MKDLSVDIETYSDIDIGKAGLYRYCDTPDFEVLLFAYAEDFGDVKSSTLRRANRYRRKYWQHLKIRTLSSTPITQLLKLPA